MADAHNPTRTHSAGQQNRPGTTGAGGAGGAGGTGHRGEEHGGVTDALRQAASTAGDVAGQVRERVQDAASNVAGRVEDAWDSARQGVQQGARAVADTAGDFWGDTTDLIRRYPVASVMIAFGAGMLAASLFSAAPRWSDDVAQRMSRGSA